MKTKKTTKSRAFGKAAKWQIIITITFSLIFLMVAGAHAAISALAGGLSVIIGSYVGIKLVTNNQELNPGSVLIAMLKAEAIKLFVVTLLLLAVFKYYQGLVPLSLIGGLAGSALASGAGLRSVDNEKN